MDEPTRRAISRHLAASSPLVEEACLLPGPDDGWVAVVRPRASAFAAQQVLRPSARLRELCDSALETAPGPRARVARVVVASAPLPRGADGEHDLQAVAGLLQRAAPAAPAPSAAAQRLLERLPAVLGLPGPVTAGQRLEEELGLDSLDLTVVRELLEREFGARVADDEVWRLQTVGDLLERADRATPRDLDDRRSAPDPGWGARLRAPAAVPLERRFTIPRRGLRHLIASLGMLCLRLFARLFFRLELQHAERLPKEGPFLLCPTHASLLDSPLVYAAFPQALVHRTVFLAFGPYFRRAPLSILVRMGRLILTGEGGSVADSLRVAFDALQKGMVVCIFPEGNCSPTGAIMAARPGVGLLACAARVPIVPVLYVGSSGTCSPSVPGLRPVKIKVVVGEPLPPPAPGEEGRAAWQAVAERWRAAVLRLQAEVI